MNGFRENKIKLIFASDVAARGLDIPNTNLIIHYSLSDDMNNFIHRSGRTGRSGNKGTNIVFNHGDSD